MGEESYKREVSWFHINVVIDCTSQTGTPPIEKNAEALPIFSFEQKQKGERGFSVSNGWERTEAIPKREKGDDSFIITATYSLEKFATRGLLETDHAILNHGQATWTTPELAPPLLATTPHQLEDVSALDTFNVHRCPTWRVFSGTGLGTREKASHNPIPIPFGYRGHF
ncbi:uncharacterized protein TNCV_208061 [Trichonephila clavipes]|uniref:Uncharacterized protein n=1 Tax=Trichonephila clavipes TaxID=2585209 RepID=A0A8X6SUB2_TRICX|nr:uncharacterized protein TNCV_208061 [Trichonephila clavipes]